MPVSLTYVFHVYVIGSSISALAWSALMLPLLPAAVDTRYSASAVALASDAGICPTCPNRVSRMMVDLAVPAARLDVVPCQTIWGRLALPVWS